MIAQVARVLLAVVAVDIGVRGRCSFLLGSAPDFSPGCYYCRAIFDLCGYLGCDSGHVASSFLFCCLVIFGFFQRYKLTFGRFCCLFFPEALTGNAASLMADFTICRKKFLRVSGEWSQSPPRFFPDDRTRYSWTYW